MTSRDRYSSEPLRRLVLVVDDDSVYTLLAIESLTQAGFDVVSACNAEEAFAQFRKETPDLILLDVDLPGTNGLDICAALRASEVGSNVPIVVVTGHNDTGSIARAFLAGATDFINKPVLWQTLAQRIGFILRAQDNIRALRISEQKNHALIQALPDTLHIASADGTILQHIIGDHQASRESHVGLMLEDVVPADVARAARQLIAERADPKVLSTHDFEIGKGPEQRCYETRLRPQADGTLLVVTRDTTERRRAEAQIRYLAYFDMLTGLPNRQLFVREVGRAIRSARRSGKLLGLLYLDLDRFKRINDNLGHAIGDALLKGVARRLEQSVRASDTVYQNDASRGERSRIARLGGDEFVVLLTDLDEQIQATVVAERIGRALAEPFECGGHRFVVTPSIGIALYPKDGTEIEDLLIKADMAMYKAKDQGRNGHAFYGESMAIRSLGRLELENDLRRAFEAGQFQIYYQPKIDLHSGQAVGVEALLRWHHPERGWISPETFIPIAEETGLVVALGEWVIREACRQLHRWKGGPLQRLSIAVNVSVQQFAREDFVDSVLAAIRHSDVRPEQLELEITESLLLRNAEDTMTCLRKFRAAGLTLSIDDFGTGYSSLGYLRQFPVDALKIDRSFVKDLHTSGDDAAICAAIIAMARELKLKVIAEGVENFEQLEFLRKHKCDQAQGFLLSRPIPVEELELLLGAQSDRDGTSSYAAAS